MTLKWRALLLSLILFMAFFMLSSTAFAKAPTTTTKPGWGFGDTNHIHTGPPRLSVYPINSPDDIKKQSVFLKSYFNQLRLYLNNFFLFKH